MDIRKCKVEKNREWSANTQKVLASFLGVSAVSMLAACDLATSADVSVQDSSDSAYITSGDVADPDEIRLSSPSPSPESSSSSPSSVSSSQPRSSSSFGPVSGVSSSSFYPPLAGIVMPESSSSYPVDTLEITSGEIVPPMESSSSSSLHYANSSSGVPMMLSSSSFVAPPPEAGVPVDEFHENSSSSRSEEPGPLAGIPELSSSSSEPEPLGGDPIEPPEPLSGDVAEPDPVIRIDDPKD